jgi:hypothetical protein
MNSFNWFKTRNQTKLGIENSGYPQVAIRITTSSRHRALQGLQHDDSVVAKSHEQGRHFETVEGV